MCITAFSQDLTVTVTDISTFQGLPEIKVTLINSSRNISMEQTTDALGKATFKSLPTINGYVVKFEGNDQYESAESSVINIRSNENPSVVLSILSKNDDNTLDTVVINSQTSNRINRRDAEVSFELEAAEIQEIPVE